MIPSVIDFSCLLADLFQLTVKTAAFMEIAMTDIAQVHPKAELLCFLSVRPMKNLMSIERPVRSAAVVTTAFLLIDD